MTQSRIPDQQLDLTWEDFAPGPIVGVDTPVVNHAKVIEYGKKIDILLNFSGTVSSTPTEITATLPVSQVLSGGHKILSCAFTTDGGLTYEPAVCIVNISDGLFHIQRSGGTAFANGAISISINGTYEAA